MFFNVRAAVFLVLCLTTVFQFSLFLYERDVFASDAITSPPLSGEFWVFGGPIAKTHEKMTTLQKFFYWRAIREFPNIEACSVADKISARRNPKINWSRLNSHIKIELCLHHMVANSTSVAQLIEWFVSEGFKSPRPIHNDDNTTLNFSWNVTVNEQLSPMDNFYFRYLVEWYYSSSISIQLVLDNKNMKLIRSNMGYGGK